ncbi:MAG: LysM peptidoglycan-binding domain-containing protein [Myxococcota bacterium]|nr:LysM peptidoglycan-binding domain-containing protein [Myxococcota bacterium]
MRQGFFTAGLFIIIALVLLPVQAGSPKRKTYTIKKGDTPFGIAKRFDVPLDELLRYNNLRPNKSPFQIGTVLKIPFKGEVTGAEYIVKPGDSIAKIADFHAVSQIDLREANGLGKRDTLRSGQKIVIPMMLRRGASRSHVVRAGDTIGAIAAAYKVSVKNLLSANKLTPSSPIRLGRTLIIPDDEELIDTYHPLKTDRHICSGVKIKGGVRHTVQPGQSMWIIARAYGVSGQDIARYNGLKPETPLKVGQTIVIPGAKVPVPVKTKGIVIRPIRLVSVWNDKAETLTLIRSNGRVDQTSRKRLSELVRPKRSKKLRLLHPRLIQMIQQVADQYPDKIIDIVSGYRPDQTGNESQHTKARAIDFRVRGVPNKALYEFCQQLPQAGCGYYPNSFFIHMDARDKPATWTDLSSAKEPSRYVKRVSKKAAPE